MQTKEYWVEKYQLLPHPEGGFYGEVYQSEEMLPSEALPSRFAGSRKMGTGIYFLIDSENFSAFHRLQADEIWHHYTGATVTLHFIDPQGHFFQRRVGSDPESGALFQVLAPSGHWFAATVDSPGAYALTGCTMAPGFDFEDFELARREQLIMQFPRHEALIRRLTRA